MDVAFGGVIAIETAFILFVAHNTSFLSIVEALAILLSAVGLPFYVGIIRGAAIDELDTERILGWMILVAANGVGLALVLISTGFHFAVYIGAVIVISGVASSWWLGGRLCSLYGIERDHNRRVILAGGCITAVFFSVAIFGIGLVIALVNIAASSVGLVASYFVIGWVALIYVFYVAGAQKTWVALINRQTLLEEFEHKHKRLDKFIRSAQAKQNPLFDATEFAFAATGTLRRQRRIYFLALLSFITIGFATDSLRAPINWPVVYFLGLGADCMLIASLIMYLGIPQNELLQHP